MTFERGLASLPGLFSLCLYVGGYWTQGVSLPSPVCSCLLLGMVTSAFWRLGVVNPLLLPLWSGQGVVHAGTSEPHPRHE